MMAIAGSTATIGSPAGARRLRRSTSVLINRLHAGALPDAVADAIADADAAMASGLYRYRPAGRSRHRPVLRPPLPGPGMGNRCRRGAPATSAWHAVLLTAL